MSASARGSNCHAGDVSSLPQGWTHHNTSQRESPPSSISPLLGMASQIASSAGVMTTPNPMSSTSYFEAPTPDTLAHMTFQHVSASTSPSGSSPLHPHPNNTGPKTKESHDSKRIKVEGPNGHKAAAAHNPSAMNSGRIDCAVPFHEDPSQFRSFEIDYSKGYGPSGQARFMTEVTPRLGNGFYLNVDKPAAYTESNMPATIEEDFFDDNAFEQGLSDDEDSPENLDQPEAAHHQEAHHQETHHHESHIPETHDAQAHREEPSHPEARHHEDHLLGQAQVPSIEQSRTHQSSMEQLPASTSSSTAPLASWDKSHLAAPPSTMGLSAGPMWSSLQHTLQQQSMQQSMQQNMQHHMHPNMQQPSAMSIPVATPNPSGNMFALTPEERRRLIEIALGPSGLPTFYPPSRFNFNMTNDYLNPAMQQANPISMRFGIGNDPAALRLLSTDPSTTESTPTPHSHAPQNTQSHSAVGGGPGYPSDRDARGSRQNLRHHPRLDTAGAGAHSRAIPAPSRRMMAEASAKARSADRVAHNDVERKYRTNLRDKIAELRNAVPVLRQAYDSERSPAAASSKVSKGTVLTKATEYIHHLEQRNRDIMIEHQQLTHRLQAFETLLHSSLNAEMIPSHSMTLFDPRGFC